MLAGGTQHSSQQFSERLAKLDWKTVERDWKDTISLIPGNPDGAIRAARTSLESVCKHICEERNSEYPEGGDLSRLYKAAAITPDRP